MVYSCRRAPSADDVARIRELLERTPVVVDSSDAGWLDALPAGAEWARVHLPEGSAPFVEVVVDPVAGIQAGRGVELLLAGIAAASVEVPALPGLVADRLANCMANEAYFVVEEGTAGRGDVDTALRLGMNHPVGPFEHVRRAGVVAVHASLRSMREASGDSRYRASALLDRERAGVLR